MEELTGITSPLPHFSPAAEGEMEGEMEGKGEGEGRERQEEGGYPARKHRDI